MMRNVLIRGAMALTLIGGLALGAAAQQPSYTPMEYNAYVACQTEQNPQQRIKCLDDFSAKYPKSDLLPFPYGEYLYLTTYTELRNHAKVIELADRISSREQLDLGTRLNMLFQRSTAFLNIYDERNPDPEKARAARQKAELGVQLLAELQKPENVTAEAFDQAKRTFATTYHYTAALAALGMKDFAGGIEHFQRALAANPGEAGSYNYRMGLAYLQMNPPQYDNGFWALARAISRKIQGEAQVRSYLRAQLARYMQVGCESIVDEQFEDLILNAAESQERPAGYRVISGDELQRVRDEIGAEFFNALREGGERGTKTFYAFCGLPFPEVFGKVLETTENEESQTFVIKLFLGATPEETEAGTVPNMELRVAGQPEVKRLVGLKDWPIKFSGTLSGYTADPFMLVWTEGKVDPESLPEETTGPGKAKRPAKRP